MNSPNPGQPIHAIKPLPTPQSAALGASSRGLGATRSVSTAGLNSPSPVATPTAGVAAPSFNPLSLMRPAPTIEALQAKTRAMLGKVREEEVARDASLRRAHLLMLSLGRDYRNHSEGVASALNKNKYANDSNNSPQEQKQQQVTDMTLDEVFEPLVEDLNDADIVYDRCLDQSRGIAHRIGGTTRIAEVSSTHVKRLDVLLSRVHETKTLVESILEKESQLDAMAGAMRANDLVKASEAVGAYERAKRRVLIARHWRLGAAGLKGASPPSPSRGSPNSDDRNTTTANNKNSVLEQMLYDGVPEDRIPLELFSDESDKSDIDDDDGVGSKQHTNISESFDTCEDDEAYYRADPDGLVGETVDAASSGRARAAHGKSATSKTVANASLTKKKKMSIVEERALVLKVKEALIGRIRDQLAQAVASGKREEVIKAVQLLAKVQPPTTTAGDDSNTPQKEQHRGKNAFLLNKNHTIQPTLSSSSSSTSVGEACLSYVQWVCDAALKELTARVDGELQTLKKAKNNEQSHLGSAAAALDHVVATLEQEEAFVAETFGKEGLVTLLESLHKRCTSDVVRIIRDYLSMRKISSGTAAKTTSGSSMNSGSGHAKKLDQTLEEIAHLVCCCHMYMRYVDERYHEALLEGSSALPSAAAAEGVSSGGETKKTAKATNTNKDEAAGAVFDRSHYSAFVTKDNPLFEAIQELLAVFIPMQKEYFTTAFAQSIEMDREVLGNFAVAQAKERAKQLGLTTGQHSNSGGGGGSDSGGGGIFGTLNSLVSNSNNSSAAIAGGSGANGALLPANIKELLDDPTFSLSSPAPDVVFVDDLFYVLRIAVHRAFSTRSNIIASSILMAVTELITDSVAKEVLRRIRVRPEDEGAVLRGSVQTLSGVLSAAASAASASAMLPSSTKKTSAGVLLGTAKGSHHTPQQLEALFHDLSSGRNLYSPTIWLTPELLAKEERGGRGGSKQSKTTSHFLDIDPLTMLPTGRGISSTYHSPQPFSSSSMSTAAESSATLHQSRLFQWVAAAFNMCLYLRKLSRDVEPLSTQYFGDSRADLVRFREQRHEMESIAFWLEENVKLALCDLCYALAEEHYVSPSLMKIFMAAQYSMSEEEFAKLDRLASIMSPVAGTIGGLASYNNNNTNTSATTSSNSTQQQQLWVGPLVAAWSVATRRLRAQLSQREEVFELVMSNIIEQIALKLEHCIIPEGVWVPADSNGYGDSNSGTFANDEVRVIDGVKMVLTYPPAPKPMVVNDYGALQLDKDMRQLRGHFLNTIDGNVPIRERFARLSAITTLLLVDRIEDVPDVCHGLSEVLSAEDKRRVLLMKSGLASPAEIKALKL